MTRVMVRPATPEDAHAIASIHVASWQGAYRGILPEEYLDTLSPDQRLPMWRSVLESSQPPVHVGVAEFDGEVAGFYSIGPSNEGDPDDVLMLSTIYMHPASMGGGVGQRLMIDAERQMRARGATSGILRVITANARTLRFYARCGWSPETDTVRMEDAWGQQVETMRYRKRL